MKKKFYTKYGLVCTQNRITKVIFHWIIKWKKLPLILKLLLGYVCFPKNTFRETIFQTFLCLFVIRKVGQRKTLSGQQKILSSQRKIHSGQRKTLSSQRKIWLGFQENVFPLAVFVFRKVVSGKSLSKLSCVCLLVEKLVNGKHFPVKEKFGLVFRKVFSWKIWGENTFWKLWKI